ncbi:hypothetical protein [Facklamia sp. 7083-14-GEN3]|uniref:hypothetical protein n=1 Tax=Facklamia sp. 7083-14-GEN3 TaxID=2973478 RepID=UPI00215CBEE5|nr:hypothetical protein [Facklamia sp. 7083-14-GEN3]MCR8969126.1 hypothetical protein [Facklamia sp. 7083-14-GEN3]
MKELLGLTYFEIQRQKLYWMIVALIYSVLSLISINSQIQSNLQQKIISDSGVLLNAVNIAFVIGILAMAIAAFLIWLKDWFSQSKMISRWLAGPFKRPNLYHAKFLSLIFYFLLSILSVYLWVFLLDFILNLTLQENYSNEIPLYLMLNFSYFKYFFTESIILSVINFLAWMSLIPITFLLVILERAYTWAWSLLYLIFFFVLLYATGQILDWGILTYSLEFGRFIPFAAIFVGAITYWIGCQRVAKDLHI